MNKKCPKCGSTKFLVTAHVTQDWIVGSDGEFLVAVNQCAEVTHRPNDDDIWTCANCGLDDAGRAFNVTNDDESVD